MARQPGPKGGIDRDPKARQAQRAEALRANLAKRKQQANARRGGKAIAKGEPSALDDGTTPGEA